MLAPHGVPHLDEEGKIPHWDPDRIEQNARDGQISDALVLGSEAAVGVPALDGQVGRHDTHLAIAVVGIEVIAAERLERLRARRGGMRQVCHG